MDKGKYRGEKTMRTITSVRTLPPAIRVSMETKIEQRRRYNESQATKQKGA